MNLEPAGRQVARYVHLEMEEIEPLHIEGRVRDVDHLLGLQGTVRAGALLVILDTAGGLCGGLGALPDGWVVSTNLCARAVAPARGPLRANATVLRKGRNNIVTAVAIHDAATDALVLDGVLTSAILVPDAGPPVWERPVRMSTGDGPVEHVAMDEWLGARTVDTRTIEIDLRDGLRNPWGILHGGVSAALVDVAAAHAAGGGTTTDVVLHFLAPNRAGPVRATADVLGERSDGRVLRVELQDVGAERVTGVAIATVASPAH